MKFIDGTYKTKISLIFFFCFFYGLGEAQSLLVFKNYKVNEGLSHNFVRKTIQDSKGFIWIATIDGLNRFDGYTFKSYKTKFGDSTSLSSDNIMTIAEDKHGNIWVGAWGGGVCIYDRKLDNFKRIPLVAGKRDSYATKSSFINTLYEDAKGRIWIGTYDKGISVADPDKLIFTHYLHDPKNPASVSSNNITAITEDEKGQLWIGTIGGGLNYFNPKTGRFIHFMHQENNTQSLSGNDVLNVFYDSKQRLWAGTTDKVLNLMKDQSGQFVHFKHQFADPKSLGDHRVTSIEESDDHKIWIGTDHGLHIYNEQYGNFDHYIHKPFDPKSLSSNQIKSINRDRRGGMWVATYNGGVNFFDKSFVKILHYFSNPDTTSLSANDVSAFVQLKNDSILIGTDARGLNLFNRKTDRFTHFQHDPEDPRSLAGNLIKYLMKDKKGRIWMGLWGAGIDRFDERRGTFIHLKVKTGSEDWLTGANVTCMAEDKDGFIWASTWGSGVIKFHPDNNTFEHFAPEENNPHSLTDKNAWAILSDHENNIWVGNSSGVIDLFDRKNARFSHFDTKRPGESSAVILAIFEDSKHRIWIGSEGAGLKLLDRKNKTFKTYKVEDGLPSNYISAIEEDAHGNLWLGTNHGLARFDPASGNIKNYGLSYGLQSLQFNRLSSIRLPSGEMMFGGVNGFNLFHPDSLIEMPNKIPIVFTDFQIFNKPVFIGGKDSLLQTDVNETRSVTLSYTQSVFSLEYAALYFPDPENVRYKYRLKGFVNESWQEVGKDRKVTYTNLDPGDYVFEVALDRPDGENASRALEIIVMPPWWKTWWFTISVAFIVLSGAFIFYKMRINLITNQKKMLEEEVTIRTAELREANVDLKITNEKVNAQKEEIETQSEALKDLYVDLNSSIKAAESIQQTILTSAAYIKDYFPESFIFYKPKDVVSGDFYWFNVVNDAIVLAAVDCTGHGVSGAIMSIHAYHLLNLAIDSLGTVSPDEVLERLNKIVHKEFTQRENENEKTLAGMDIAMCVIDKAKKRLQFSGAVNPVYILRDKEIIQIKGSKYPIGLINQDGKKMFSKQEVDLKRGDKVYIFSDGYSDQFGGENGDEKFMYFRFRDLLVAMSDMRMQDQASVLEETLNQWKGKLDQMDDILVIGVEI